MLPVEVPFATILTMGEVDPADPAFKDPTKFVGPVYDKAEADRLAADKGWASKPDGDSWRRVVPSPQPRRIFEIRPIRWLLDKDLASELLAREVGADLFVMVRVVGSFFAFA